MYSVCEGHDVQCVVCLRDMMYSVCETLSTLFLLFCVAQCVVYCRDMVYSVVLCISWK